MGMNINIQNVRCGYKGKVVVDEFSAVLSSGDILCLLGPNGVGKTTLFKCLLGFLPLMAGSVFVDGRDMKQLKAAEYAKIVGYVPQAHAPPFSFRVFDVVLMGRTAHLGIFAQPGPEDKRVVWECLEKLEIKHLAAQVYTEISGGERQMVLIARALAQEPAFLLMDEPTSNLDFGNQARVLHTICTLAEMGLGILMTTHQPDQVFQCDADVSLLMPDHEHLCGSADDILTEQTLRRAYGIDVAVLEARRQEQVLRLCQPILPETRGGNRNSQAI
jgi:iron complex transport system ATP-binding protein